jgi:hypothetical protein
MYHVSTSCTPGFGGIIGITHFGYRQQRILPEHSRRFSLLGSFANGPVAADVISLAPSRRDHPSAANVPEPSVEIILKIKKKKNSNNFFM